MWKCFKRLKSKEKKYGQPQIDAASSKAQLDFSNGNYLGMIAVPAYMRNISTKSQGQMCCSALHGRFSSYTMTHLIRSRSASAVPPIPVAFHRLPYIMWFTVPVHPIKPGRETRLKYIKGQRTLTISPDTRGLTVIKHRCKASL